MQKKKKKKKNFLLFVSYIYFQVKLRAILKDNLKVHVWCLYMKYYLRYQAKLLD